MKSERVTFEGNFCEIARCRETPGGSFCKDGYCSQRLVWERLKEFEDLKAAGLLVRLPCEVGSKCYDIIEGEVYENDASYITIGKESPERDMTFVFDDLEVAEKDFDMVFATREEAEAALKKQEEADG